ncbi:MAG: DnaA N-terminal domain-containing protein [Anaerolineaceae bacterium]
MNQSVQTPITIETTPNVQQAWEVVKKQLRPDMTPADFETWITPLCPLRFDADTFVLGAQSDYARDWIEGRLRNRITRTLTGIYARQVELLLKVLPRFEEEGGSPDPLGGAVGSSLHKRSLAARVETGEGEAPIPESGKRKFMLQRAYGSERAKIIQPERGMFVTHYFFNQWLPLLGHSAATVVLAARGMCYWNPLTGELRNTIETDMSELAKRASVSVRTVKDVLANPLIHKHFLRYTVRRIFTPNGVRTAGISLQVRMDDPLSPDDQENNHLIEEDHWYSVEFEGDEEEE